jgi:hypothetical protein
VNYRFIFRVQEWWGAILPPILLFYYLGIIENGGDSPIIYKNLVTLIIISIITALIGYYSNNYYDINDDLKAGKKNQLNSLPDIIKWLLIPAQLILLAVVIYLGIQKIHFHFVSIAIGINIILFFLYSIPPARLKKNKYISTLLDASYSGTLFYLIAFYIANPSGEFQLIFGFLIFFWGITKGLRNYITHLCDDHENDLKLDFKTLSTAYSKEKMQSIAHVLYPLEIILLIFLLSSIASISIIALIFCLLFFIFWFSHFKKDSQTKISFLNDLYEVWIPAFIVTKVVIINPHLYPLLIIHFILFSFHIPKIYFSIKNSIFKILNKEPKSIAELINGFRK